MRLALLEDDEERAARMCELMRATLPDAEIVRFDEAPRMIDWLRGNLADIAALSLDHDLGPSRATGDGSRMEPGTGRDVVDVLVTLGPKRPIIVHSSNVLAVSGMLLTLEAAGWPVSRVAPFNDLEWIERGWLPAICRALIGLE